jgi:hypothetical protein
MLDLFNYIGLGAPFTAAAGVYWLFHFLDKKAADAPRQAVASWIRGNSYKTIDLGDAFISSFDHLYSTPLFRFRAFGRSARLSLMVFVVYRVFFTLLTRGSWANFFAGIATIALLIIISDYLSLFVIRRCLVLSKRFPGLSVMLAFIAGAIMISILLVLLRAISDIIFLSRVVPNFDRWAALHTFVDDLRWGALTYSLTNLHAVLDVLPAFLVQFWLHLLLIGSLITSGLSAFLKATGFSQWFLQRGDEHPFEAIGLAASVFVFAVLTIAHFTNYFLRFGS